MAYSDFTLQDVGTRLGIKVIPADLFPNVVPARVPDWLTGSLANVPRATFLTEKARSEFLVAPVLSAFSVLTERRLSLFSGVRLDADSARGLTGECDFVFTMSDSVAPLRGPVVTMVEAKKQDIEVGLGQCIAQMVGARTFNEAAGLDEVPIFGCVTTGDVWQFLKLEELNILHDGSRYFINEVGKLLGVLLAIDSICSKYTFT